MISYLNTTLVQLTNSWSCSSVYFTSLLSAFGSNVLISELLGRRWVKNISLLSVWGKYEKHTFLPTNQFGQSSTFSFFFPSFIPYFPLFYFILFYFIYLSIYLLLAIYYLFFYLYIIYQLYFFFFFGGGGISIIL